MYKKIILVAAVILLAASCNKGGKSAGNDQSKDNQSAAQGQSSFKDLIAMGKPQKCSAWFTAKDVTSTGTIYLASQQMRGDFTAQVQGKTMQTHMIVKNQTVYTWVEGMGTTIGFQTSLHTSSSTSNTTQSRSVDVNQKVSYNCEAWTEDDSVFALPAGVTFTSTAAITPNGAAGKSESSATSSKSSQCSTCDNAGAGKAQCLAVLHCI